MAIPAREMASAGALRSKTGHLRPIVIKEAKNKHLANRNSYGASNKSAVEIVWIVFRAEVR